MAKRGRKRVRKHIPKAKWHLSGSKVALARKRGHKPLALLKLYHSKMERNLDRLGNIIEQREAIGE